MKTWIKSTLAAGLAIAVLGAGVTTTQPAFADGHAKAGKMMHDAKKKMNDAMAKMKGPKVVKVRRLSMRAISKANKNMKAAAKKGNTRGVVRASLQIIRHANALPRMFPKGTGRGKLSPAVTRSTPAIWKNWGKLIQANNAMRNAATRVAIAANAGNKKAGLKGIGKTCGGCHKPFRGKKVSMKK